MDRNNYRPPYRPQPHHTPNYRPPAPQSDGPWPPRFCAPPPNCPVPQYGTHGAQPLHFNGVDRSISSSKQSWPQECDMRRPEGPGVEPTWRGHTGNSANGHGRARLSSAEVNISVDQKQTFAMNVETMNSWQHHNDYQTSTNNGIHKTIFSPGVPPSMPNMAQPPPNMAMPPPSPNMAIPPPCLSYGYSCSPQTTSLSQPSQSVYLQQPPLDCSNVTTSSEHLQRPPVTQYSYSSGHQQETGPSTNTSIVSPHSAIPGMYTDSQNSNDVPKSVPQGCINGQHHKDQVWVNHWLEQHQHLRRRKTKSQQQQWINIPEARLKLHAAVLLSDKLKHCCIKLERETLLPELERTNLSQEVEQIKAELSRLKAVFENGQVVAKLQQKLKRIALKRERIKRQRQREYMQKLEAEEQRQKAHEQLDQWQQSIVEKSLQLKRDKELKAAADDTLREVRSKLTDTKKALQLMTDLQKLRQVRKEMAEKKGLFVRHDVDNNFEIRVSSLVDMLIRQNKTYETEKDVLEVMLETEQQETEERQKEEQERKLAAREQRVERRIRRVLFGVDESIQPSHPLYPYRQYYEAGENTANAFLQIRQEWDVFLVHPGTEGGSRVPLHWILPTEPSSDTWATALVK